MNVRGRRSLRKPDSADRYRGTQPPEPRPIPETVQMLPAVQIRVQMEPGSRQTMIGKELSSVQATALRLLTLPSPSSVRPARSCPTLARLVTAHNGAVIGITAEAVAAPLQFLIQVIQQQIGEQQLGSTDGCTRTRHRMRYNSNHLLGPFFAYGE